MAIIDKTNFSFQLTEDEKKTATKEKTQTNPYIMFSRQERDNIVALAVEDGFKFDAESERGLEAQKNKVTKKYLMLALDICVEMRTKAKAKAEAKN